MLLGEGLPVHPGLGEAAVCAGKGVQERGWAWIHTHSPSLTLTPKYTHTHTHPHLHTHLHTHTLTFTHIPSHTHTLTHALSHTHATPTGHSPGAGLQLPWLWGWGDTNSVAGCWAGWPLCPMPGCLDGPTDKDGCQRVGTTHRSSVGEHSGCSREPWPAMRAQPGREGANQAWRGHFHCRTASQGSRVSCKPEGRPPARRRATGPVQREPLNPLDSGGEVGRGVNAAWVIASGTPARE